MSAPPPRKWRPWLNMTLATKPAAVGSLPICSPDDRTRSGRVGVVAMAGLSDTPEMPNRSDCWGALAWTSAPPARSWVNAEPGTVGTVIVNSACSSVSTNSHASVVAGRYWKPFLAMYSVIGPKPTHTPAITDVVSPGTQRAAFGAIELLPRPEPPPLPITTDADGAETLVARSPAPCVPWVLSANVMISPRNMAVALAAATWKMRTEALDGALIAGLAGKRPE